MTWAQFNTYVLEELGTDATRRGISDLRTRSIRDAVIDLQRFIRAFRDGHTTVYLEADLTEDTYGHLGTLPAGAKPKAFYTISLVPDEDDELPDPNCERNRHDFVDWKDRRGMICNVDRCHYTYAIAPFKNQFLIHPLINDETKLLLVYDGLKMTFDDADVVPWPEQAAECVAAYVKAKILRVFDRRPDLAADYYVPAAGGRPASGLYVSLRLALFREQNEASDADGNDQEYGVTATTAPTPP